MRVALRELVRGGVGQLAPGGVDWMEQPQATEGSFVVLQTISGSDGHTHDGPDGLFQGRVQADCYADRYADAVALADALTRRLDGHSGAGFAGIFHLGTRDGLADADPDLLPRVSLDFMINWRNDNA